MGPNTLWNINDGKRSHFGSYFEWEGKHGQGWTELLGFRNDVVVMNTGGSQAARDRVIVELQKAGQC